MVLPEGGGKVNGSIYAAFKVSDRFAGVKPSIREQVRVLNGRVLNTVPCLIL